MSTRTLTCTSLIGPAFKSCGNQVTLSVTWEQASLLDKFEKDRRNAPHIQNILPDTPADIREMFLSGLCGKCYNQLLGEVLA